MTDRKITIEISEKMLNKLHWMFNGGTDEQKVCSAIKKAIRDAESEVGSSFPIDRKPEGMFKGMNLQG